MRHQEGRKTLAHHVVQGKLQNRLLQERAGVLQEIGAGAGQLDGPGNVDDVQPLAEFDVVQRREVKARRLAPSLDDDVVGVGLTFRHVLGGHVRHPQHQRFVGRLRLPQRTLQALALRRHLLHRRNRRLLGLPLQRGDLPGHLVALRLQILDPTQQAPPLLVHLQQLPDVDVDMFLARAGLNDVGLLTDESDVQHVVATPG